MRSRSTGSAARHGSGGFSLIEVVVALFILGVGILAVVQLFSTTLRSVERSDRHSRGAAYARSLLEEAYAMEGIEDVEGTYELGDDFRASRTAELINSTELEPSGREVALYDVLVVVTWPTNGYLELRGKKMVYERPE